MNKKYDYDKCFEIAKHCSCTSEMLKQSKRAYNVALKNKWIEDYVWFRPKRHIKYTYDEVYEIAKQYKCSSDFIKGNNSAYNCARQNGWLKDFNWFIRKQHLPYTYEECYKIAKQYKILSDFIKYDNGAYRRSRINKWLDDYIWLQKRKPNGWWTKERCAQESKKYKNRREFGDKCETAYKKALEKGWLDDFTWLKDARINYDRDKIDCIYAYEFTDFNSVYIGRTLMKRTKIRDSEHVYVDKDSVHLFAKRNRIQIPRMKILENKLTLKEGKEREGFWLEQYRNKGWSILNRAKTGSLGSLFNRKWTESTCLEEAKKYETIKEYRRTNESCYNVAKRNGWLKNYTWLKETRKPNGYWNSYDICHNAAKECKTRSEFAIKYDGAYRKARENNWLDDFFPDKYNKGNGLDAVQLTLPLLEIL
ncbi:MAG: hypothetical protein IK000_05485 [Bacteroidaceae bacterium]|nr:hypothetical protein [Bacteroidaceae bacterium]